MKGFIEENHRNPSKHRIEEHDMLNWVKQQRKLKNKGELKAERTEMLERLFLCISLFFVEYFLYFCSGIY